MVHANPTPGRSSDPIPVGKSCTAAAPRQCELKTTVGVALEIAEAHDLPSVGMLREIEQRGYTSEEEAYASCMIWAAEVLALPDPDPQALIWREAILSGTFGHSPGAQIPRKEGPEPWPR